MLQANLIKFSIDPRTRLTVLLIVLALLAYQLSILFWRLYPQADFDGAVIVKNPVQPERSNPTPKSRLEQADAIAATYPFGRAVVARAPTVAEKAPQTKLNYKLRGIYFSEQAAASSAIVEIRSGKSEHYYIGDEFAKNIILSSIAPDHILIDRYGKIERLNLQKPVVLEYNKLVTAREPTGSPDNNRLLQSYRQRYANNPLALAKRFQAIPVQENGQNVGFRLKAHKNESLLEKLDFNEDDIFIKVNGVSLDKPFQALDALKSLATAKSVSVTILRQGVEKTIGYNF